MMRSGYAWRFGVGTILGGATAGLLAVGIMTGGTGFLVGAVAGCCILAVYALTVIMPWTRNWANTI